MAKLVYNKPGFRNWISSWVDPIFKFDLQTDIEMEIKTNRFPRSPLHLPYLTTAEKTAP